MRTLIALLLAATCCALDLAPLRADLQSDLYYQTLPAAVTALVESPTPTGEVIAAFASESDPLVQFNLVIVLGRRALRDPPPPAEERAGILAFFAAGISHAHPWVRVESAYQLGRTGDAAHLPALRAAYGDLSDFAFLHAVIAASTILGKLDPALSPEQMERLKQVHRMPNDNEGAKRELDRLASTGLF